MPQVADPVPKTVEGSAVARHAVVLVVPAQDRSKPSSRLRNRSVHPLAQFIANSRKFGPYFLRHAFTPYAELSVARLAADMDKPKKVEGLGFTASTTSSIVVREASEFEQTCFVFVERKVELRQPFAQLGVESFCVVFVLESNHEIVGVARDDDLATCRLPIPRR